jgi:hypothetical protein
MNWGKQGKQYESESLKEEELCQQAVLHEYSYGGSQIE